MPCMRMPWYGIGLPYQYSLFVNYDLRKDSPLSVWNDEVSREDFEAANATRMPDEAPKESAAAAAAGGEERAIGGSGGLSFEEMMERELAKEAARQG